jgi:octaheme c-type cytochrome (tetrathionate reductase family)
MRHDVKKEKSPMRKPTRYPGTITRYLLYTLATSLVVFLVGACISDEVPQQPELYVAATLTPNPEEADNDANSTNSNEERNTDSNENGNGEEGERGEEEETIPSSTADHSKFKPLKQEFETAQDVIAACQGCHNQSADQLHASVHWNWHFEHPDTGQTLGKRHIIDNNVLAITGNEEYCATCHAGYGMEDAAEFDLSADTNIDCLVCHDTTGEYEKLPGTAGHPAYEPTEYPPGSGNTWEPPDLNHIAQNVGPTSRTNCGSCHFGERNVSPFIHARLPAALEQPSAELDVHMGTDYLDFSCSTCHEPQNHQFFASKYQPVSETPRASSHLVHVTCQSCHDPDKVHSNSKLTDHTDRLACQTCHIPHYARGGPEMVSWDWSAAGRTNDEGRPVVERNDDDLMSYHGHYGAFEWDENIRPEYVWFDGTITYTKVGDEIDPSETVQVNTLHGSYNNPKARLWPVRVERGVQPYDSEENTLVAVNLYGNEESAYWQSLEWDRAIEAAMEEKGLSYSGNYNFVETEMSWLLNHTIAPASKAVRCGECHQRGGVLANMSGSYVPGRDRNMVIDVVGWLLVGSALVGVVTHGSMRFTAHQKRSKKQKKERKR